MGHHYLLVDQLLGELHLLADDLDESSRDRVARIHDMLRAAPDASVHAEDPSSFKEAYADDRWHPPMGAELGALLSKGCFEIVDRVDQPLMGAVWVCKTKRNSDDKVTRLKARLAVRGNTMHAPGPRP